ncbi:MBOAT family O-acyltransferase [Chamaesiphon sp. VAR_48_metabat_135_sub]|uniref:MBOAT family O-acyltransferase n=1 Tax=Chamaesiphon sp. VAR_48_metabat_135_sub TaxID=2964699 RepID=UPI00286B4708|nr:MBOAT family O-acyltransferase [Chamaesiphon sp. VAR_48_metabat_135_sub]
MLFNSFPFLILFLATSVIYYIPIFRQLQVIILVCSSLIFYSYDSPLLLVLLLVSIFINTIISYKIADGSNSKQIRWAVTGIALNLSILILFKYAALITNLFIKLLPESNNSAAGVVTMFLHLPLPIGISFYTFEGISLLVDVLRDTADRKQSSFIKRGLPQHFLKSSLFIAFFPHLIAGPILKASNFYPQIKAKYFKDINWDIVFRSLTVGYFLKMVVADNLKDYTFWIAFPYYQTLSTLTCIVLLLGYSMQIFADFAGYSLIAVGLASVLGYELPQNFNFPYISRSITEFWRRWHISLSNWLRDYLYISLGGNRKGELRTYANLMIVMLLGGLWHGASWNYAIWGSFHGIALVLERFFSNKIDVKLHTNGNRWYQFVLDTLNILVVFCFVSIGWLFFKLSDIGQVFNFVNTMIRNVNLPNNNSYIEFVLLFSSPIIVYHLIHLPCMNILTTKQMSKYENSWKFCKNTALGVMIVMIILNSGNSSGFIYFQF